MSFKQPFPGVGASPLASMFGAGSVVSLQSMVSGQGLCIKGGRVTAKGIRDLHSQFIVHVKKYGRIALQNVADKSKWLEIFEGETRSFGDGGQSSEFNLHEVEDCYVALESALHPGQHVGVFENGNLKLAAETTPMDPASFFIPFPVEPPSFDSGVARQELPAGWQSARTPEGREYFINHTTQETSWIRPSVGPATPIGYSLREMLEETNLFIVPRCGLEHPMRVKERTLGYPKWVADGLYVPNDEGNNDSEFYPNLLSENIVMLQNKSPKFAGTVWVNDAKKIYVMRSPMVRGAHEQFVVHHIEGPIVAFESVKFPGHFVRVINNGSAVVANLDLQTSESAHFVLRMRSFIRDSRLLSPFGNNKPSIVNHLKTWLVIQLYHKPSRLFLAMSGGVTLSEDEDDPKTFLSYHDRGMGRVSLNDKSESCRLEINPDGKLVTAPNAKGLGTIQRTDFTVKESRDGALLFESCGYPGKYISLWSDKYRVLVKEFSVYLLDLASKSRITPRDAIELL